MQIEIPGYSIVSTLSQGAAATVYLALDKHPRRELALKVIALESPLEFQVQALARDRVRMQRLVHPHIVKFLDSGIHAGHYFLAMEYLSGSTLSHKRFELDLLARLRVVIGVAEALDFIAEQGYVHGGIAPENILIHAQDGRAVLIGFGLHQILEDGGSGASQPIVDTCFQSPEQMRGEVSDSRSDLYSLGVLFFLLLTDHLPFPVRSPSATDAIDTYREVPRLPEHLQSFQPFVNRLLDAQPAARYQRASEFIADLGAVPESSVRAAVAGFELSLLSESESPLQLMTRAATDTHSTVVDEVLLKQPNTQSKNEKRNHIDAKDETELVKAFFIDKEIFQSTEDINTDIGRILENDRARPHENLPLIFIAVIGLMIPLVIYFVGQRSPPAMPVENSEAITLSATSSVASGIANPQKIVYAIEPDLAQQAASLRTQVAENFALATDLVVIYRAALRGEDPAEHAFARAGLAELQQLFSDRIRAHIAAKNVEVAAAERDLALWLFEQEERLPILTDTLAAIK